MQYQNPPWHHNVNFAGTLSEFMPTDTSESFEKLQQVTEYYEYFKQKGWLEPGAISYRFNSYGFRCDEFDETDCMIALGCSFTMGIGLPVESTWPYLVGKQLGLVPYTLACGGISADTCFRFAEYWIPVLRPKAVFMLTPPPARIELIKAAGDIPIENYLPQHETQISSDIDSYLKHWFTAEENSRLNQAKNKLAIQAICYDLKIPCHIYDVFNYMAKSREEIEYARDRMHAGPKGHELLAVDMVRDYKLL